MVRAYTAKVLGMDLAQIRVIPAEIGGGFGGKTTVYLEPTATLLARKTGRPVKMVMSREEVFRATGPTSGSRIRVRMMMARAAKPGRSSRNDASRASDRTSKARSRRPPASRRRGGCRGRR